MREAPTSRTDSPATLDGASGALVPTPRRIDLATLDDVRREMGRVYREMRGGSLDTQEGSRLVFVLGQIGKLIEAGEVERRVEALERVLRQRR